MSNHEIVTAVRAVDRADGSVGHLLVGTVPADASPAELHRWSEAESPVVPALAVLSDLSAARRGEAAEAGVFDRGETRPLTWQPDEERLRADAATLGRFARWSTSIRRELDATEQLLVDEAWRIHRTWLREALQIDGDLRRAISDVLVHWCGADFPWADVQPPVKGLAILYNFSPFQDTGATVASKRLRGFGESVDVIACSFLHHKKQDPTIERIAAPYVASKYFLPMTPRWASWGAYGDFAVQAARIADAYIAREDRDYEFLYSRAMWAPSIYAGALVKLKHPELRWIAEFSDPLSLDVEGHRRGGPIPRDAVSGPLIDAYEEHFSALPDEEIRIFSLAERLAFAFADEIIFTNDNQYRTMIGMVEDEALRDRIAEHATISHHPTLPTEFYGMFPAQVETDPDTVNIAYFGEFYSSRGLTEVTTGIRTLPHHVREKIRLHVFTNYVPQAEGGERPRSFSVKQYNELVRRALDGVGAEGIEELVVFHPSLPYLQFLSTTQAFDLLVVVDARSGDSHPVNPYLPSKWSDYRGSRADTWAVIEKGSVLSTEPVPYTSPLGDARAARELLWSAVDRKRGDHSATASARDASSNLGRTVRG